MRTFSFSTELQLTLQQGATPFLPAAAFPAAGLLNNCHNHNKLISLWLDHNQIDNSDCSQIDNSDCVAVCPVLREEKLCSELSAGIFQSPWVGLNWKCSWQIFLFPFRIQNSGGDRNWDWSSGWKPFHWGGFIWAGNDNHMLTQLTRCSRSRCWLAGDCWLQFLTCFF